jgi:hypothetical protein
MSSLLRQGQGLSSASLGGGLATTTASSSASAVSFDDDDDDHDSVATSTGSGGGEGEGGASTDDDDIDDNDSYHHSGMNMNTSGGGGGGGGGMVASTTGGSSSSLGRVGPPYLSHSTNSSLSRRDEASSALSLIGSPSSISLSLVGSGRTGGRLHGRRASHSDSITLSSTALASIVTSSNNNNNNNNTDSNGSIRSITRRPYGRAATTHHLFAATTPTTANGSQSARIHTQHTATSVALLSTPLTPHPNSTNNTGKGGETRIDGESSLAGELSSLDPLLSSRRPPPSVLRRSAILRARWDTPTTIIPSQQTSSILISEDGSLTDMVSSLNLSSPYRPHECPSPPPIPPYSYLASPAVPGISAAIYIAVSCD